MITIPNYIIALSDIGLLVVSRAILYLVIADRLWLLCSCIYLPFLFDFCMYQVAYYWRFC